MKAHTLLPALLATAAGLAVAARAAELHVPADYPTVQEAVDAASRDDTVRIAAGVYAEQVRIVSKNLTLVGEPGAILRAFPEMRDSLPDNNSRCVLFIFLSSEVNVRNLSFEGEQVADQQSFGADNVNGVYHLDSGGSVENCRFTGFRERVPGSGNGRPIRCRNDLHGAPLYTYRVVGNTVEDCYTGLQVVGAPDKLSLNVTLENNHIRGVGPSENDGVEMRRGMDLGDGITGTVIGNTISGFSYSGEGTENPWGFGILAIGRGFPTSHRPLDPIRFENNTFSDNNLHLVLSKGDRCQVLNNRFAGTGPGLIEAGLWVTGLDVEVRGNTFRDMPVGIIVGGEDPHLGTDVGIATGAVLADNRFSGVDTPINHQPQSTATEEGTLIAPFPEPELQIGKAVVLSWPDFYEGWSLESSPDMTDTWFPLDLPVLQRDGRNEVVVPIDGSEEYFRLNDGSSE